MDNIKENTMTNLSFHHGALAKSYEEQANEQGFTFGNNQEFINKIAFGIFACRMHGIFSDSEFDSVIYKFQEKILMKYIKPLE